MKKIFKLMKTLKREKIKLCTHFYKCLIFWYVRKQFKQLYNRLSELMITVVSKISYSWCFYGNKKNWLMFTKYHIRISSRYNEVT